MKHTALLLFAAIAFVLTGCTDQGPKRFKISGEVTFDKQPIPHGDILFTPDGAKNNDGPQGIAQIRNGKFDTSLPDGKGIAGGHTVVRITGFSGPGGKILCETEIQIELPKSDTTKNFDVPADKAFKGTKGPEI